MTDLSHRYDFVFLFDVQDGNPNGDPDAGNLPRVDPETNHGLVTDVCIKRKVRNYILQSRATQKGFDVFVKEKAILNNLINEAFVELGIAEEPKEEKKADTPKEKGKAKKEKKERATGEDSDRARTRMCEKYYDVRTFGAVMSTGRNAGQVRGPVQVTFSRSVDPIFAQEHSITRMAVATEEEAEKQKGDNRTMGRKNTIPYGLYVGDGFISPYLARQTRFSAEDLEVLWQALGGMFELDRSAARGLMSMRRLIAFRHENELGSAPAHRLFDLVKARRKDGVDVARSFEDYVVTVGDVPKGIERLEKV
jgi:CRISPR-associated protein Csd2